MVVLDDGRPPRALVLTKLVTRYESYKVGLGSLDFWSIICFCKTKSARLAKKHVNNTGSYEVALKELARSAPRDSEAMARYRVKWFLLELQCSTLIVVFAS